MSIVGALIVAALVASQCILIFPPLEATGQTEDFRHDRDRSPPPG